jgi:hypothetical protein
MNKNKFLPLIGSLALSSLLFSGISYHGFTPIYIVIFIYYSYIFFNSKKIKYSISKNLIILITFILIYSLYGYINLKDKIFMIDRDFIYGELRPILAGIQLLVTFIFCKSIIFNIYKDKIFKQKFEYFYIIISTSILMLMLIFYLTQGLFSHSENGSFQELTRESGVAGLTVFPLLILSIYTKRYLSSGEDLPMTCSLGRIASTWAGVISLKAGPSMTKPPSVIIPHCLAIARAVAIFSPVIMRSVTPAR